MIWADKSIKQGIEQKWIGIEPFDPLCVQPASYDVHLGNTLYLPEEKLHTDWVRRVFEWCGLIRPLYHPTHYDPLTDRQPMRVVKLFPREAEDITGEYFYLPPGGVALGATQERVELYGDCKVAAEVSGCSSLARWFLQVHMTAGFVDPGWPLAPLTLELYNASPWYLRLWAGMRIGQLVFFDLDDYPERYYSDIGHYGHSLGPETSKYTS